MSNHNTTYTSNRRIVITLPDEHPAGSENAPAQSHGDSVKQSSFGFMPWFILINVIMVLCFPFSFIGGLMIIVAAFIARLNIYAGIIIFVGMMVSCDDFFTCFMFAIYEVVLVLVFLGSKK